ncbi:predicted protein [Plenodomus lingam JN3]|uniref:Predicted protein n=1 Tax=Leptosphaeria maculans (strain JN3 / isolate v23.1.3 / race Av1-4-5-6-7-8) TaxID=985895 RepID=E5A0Q3_LEPMJ|nr:predicted protein [Plenodomus lingam JN3]CBX97199.1 predicted protein [Plenodomus lingam JN3]
MKLSCSIVTTFLALAQAQAYPECTAEVARSDDCAAVINANACYNKFKFQNAQALTCIDGDDNAAKQKKVGYITASDPFNGYLALTVNQRCANAAAVWEK